MNDYIVEIENYEMASDGIEFFEQYFPSTDMILKPHIHSAVEILLMHKGDFLIYCDDTEYVVPEGGMIMFRSNSIHRGYAFKGDSRYYVLKLKPSLIMNFSSAEHSTAYLLSLSIGKNGRKTVWTKEECQQLGINEVRDRLITEYENRTFASDIAIKSGASQILLAMLRSINLTESVPERNPKLIRRIYDAVIYINRHYAEDLTSQMCADELFMSYSYFSRKFKLLTGKTFAEYLNTVRINHAEKELLSTDKSITEIAEDCGFSTSSYFIQKFKEQKNDTPFSFRAKNKN